MSPSPESRQQAETKSRGSGSSSTTARTTWESRNGVLHAWFIKCAEEFANSDTVSTTNFEEGLGRLMYVARRTRLPFFCGHLTLFSHSTQESYGLRGSTSCGTSHVRSRGRGTATVRLCWIWAPVQDEEGRPDPWGSRWYSLDHAS